MGNQSYIDFLDMIKFLEDLKAFFQLQKQFLEELDMKYEDDKEKKG